LVVPRAVSIEPARPRRLRLAVAPTTGWRGGCS